MTEQDKTPNFEGKKYTQEVSDLVNKIKSNKLNKDELKTAKKTLQDIQKIVSERLGVFNNILPDLTPTEKKIVDSQKYGISELVIKQIFDKSENVLNQNEQEQFICLLTKVLKSSSKREQNKIFKGSDDLKEALYLHNDGARREKLKNKM